MTNMLQKISYIALLAMVSLTEVNAAAAATVDGSAAERTAPAAVVNHTFDQVYALCASKTQREDVEFVNKAFQNMITRVRVMTSPDCRPMLDDYSFLAGGKRNILATLKGLGIDTTLIKIPNSAPVTTRESIDLGIFPSTDFIVKPEVLQQNLQVALNALYGKFSAVAAAPAAGSAGAGGAAS